MAEADKSEEFLAASATFIHKSIQWMNGSKADAISPRNSSLLSFTNLPYQKIYFQNLQEFNSVLKTLLKEILVFFGFQILEMKFEKWKIRKI